MANDESLSGAPADGLSTDVGQEATAVASAPAASTQKPSKQVTGAPKGKAKKKDKFKGRPPTPQYNVRATIVRRQLTVGDQSLFRLVELQWPHVHHALYYITVFAPESIGGRVVTAANKGIKAYISEKLEVAKQLLKDAQEVAQDAGVLMGEHGFTKEVVVEVSSQVETDVLQLIRTLDDYVVVSDSLWIGREIDDKKKEDAHADVKSTLSTLHKLAIRMRTKLIEYRKSKIEKNQTKSDQDIAVEFEQMVLGMTGIDIQTARPAALQDPVSDGAPQKVPAAHRANLGDQTAAGRQAKGAAPERAPAPELKDAGQAASFATAEA